MSRQAKQKAQEVLAMLYNEKADFESDIDDDEGSEQSEVFQISSASSSSSSSEGEDNEDSEDGKYVRRGLGRGNGVVAGHGRGSGVVVGNGRGSGVVSGNGRSRGRSRGRGQGVDIADPYPQIDRTSKDGIEWHKMETGSLTSFRHNIEFNSMTGASFLAKTRVDTDPLSAWRLLFDNFMIKSIVRYTNEEAARCGISLMFTPNDLLRFIAILYARGLFCQKISLNELWSNYGPKIIKDIMPRDRFRLIKKYLRFDSKTSRSRDVDKFTMIREIWDHFFEVSKVMYKPGKNLTIDEQLFPSKSRCSFIQYMANKPDKFGIKFWLICCLESKYVLTAEPYLGKSDLKPTNELVGENVVKTLAKPFLNKGHCICTDNFFSSFNVAKHLVQYKTTFIGTMRRSKRELPAFVFLNLKLHDSCFYQHLSTGCVLTTYQCKAAKNVTILSTEVDDSSVPTRIEKDRARVRLDSSNVVENMKKKPKSVLIYNSLKCGVDSVDQMSRQYNVKVPTRRWPMQCFYNLLNICGINSWIVYKSANESIKISRRQFLIQVVEAMATCEHINQEIQSPLATKRMIPNENQTPPAKRQLLVDQKTSPRETVLLSKCKVLQDCNRNPAKYVCDTCKLTVCGTCCSEIHTRAICKKCSFFLT
jgi:hypothetical protein